MPCWEAHGKRHITRVANAQAAASTAKLHHPGTHVNSCAMLGEKRGLGSYVAARTCSQQPVFASTASRMRR
eukprot:6212710-Pleurochrysis_carterae.AAC.9